MVSDWLMISKVSLLIRCWKLTQCGGYWSELSASTSLMSNFAYFVEHMQQNLARVISNQNLYFCCLVAYFQPYHCVTCPSPVLDCSSAALCLVSCSVLSLRLGDDLEDNTSICGCGGSLLEDTCLGSLGDGESFSLA